MTQEQQRALLHLQDKTYDFYWLRLQAMRIPRPDRFASDLARIVAAISQNLALTPPLDLNVLEAMLHTGIQQEIDGEDARQ